MVTLISYSAIPAKILIRRISIILLMFALSFQLLCPPNIHALTDITEKWVARYEGPRGKDRGKAITVDKKGNVYVTGESEDKTRTDLHYLTIKYDSTGKVIWKRRYNTNTKDSYYPMDIAVDSKENVYVTGVCSRSNGDELCTVKYKSNGKKEWSDNYTGPRKDVAFSSRVAIDANDNAYICGTVYGGKTYDWTVIKYTTNGKREWISKIKNGGANAIVSNNNDIYVSGYRKKQNKYLIMTVKYDAEGNKKWGKTNRLKNSRSSIGHEIAVDKRNNIFVTGIARKHALFRYVTLKYRSDGKQVWRNIYIQKGSATFDETDEPYLAVSGDGGCFIAGTSGGNFDSRDFVTIKYSASGKMLWKNKYDGPEGKWDKVRGIASDARGNAYVGGCSTGYRYFSDYTVIKYNPKGTEKWVVRYNGPDNKHDYLSDLAVNRKGTLYVTGGSKKGSMDFVTIKYKE